MKKTILKTLIAVLTVGFVFSSCLGDSHGKAEYNNSIAYVYRAESGVQNAFTNVGGYNHITDPSYIQKLRAGEFYKLSYKINTKDGMSADAAWNVHEVMPVDPAGEPVPSTVTGIAGTMPKFEFEIFPANLGVSFYSPSKEDLNNKFVFSYDCEVDEADLRVSSDYSDNISLVGTLARDNQQVNLVGEEGKENLKDNQIRVNLSLVKGEDRGTPGGKKIQYKTGLGSVDLSAIRFEFERRGLQAEQGQDYALGWIVFQYERQLKDGKTETVSLGNFSDLSKAYGMYIPKN